MCYHDVTLRPHPPTSRVRLSVHLRTDNDFQVLGEGSSHTDVFVFHLEHDPLLGVHAANLGRRHSKERIVECPRIAFSQESPTKYSSVVATVVDVVVAAVARFDMAVFGFLPSLVVPPARACVMVCLNV